MAANLNKISDRVRDISKTNRQHREKPKPKESKLKSKGLLAHRQTERPPFSTWVEYERVKVGHYPLEAEVCSICYKLVCINIFILKIALLEQ